MNSNDDENSENFWDDFSDDDDNNDEFEREREDFTKFPLYLKAMKIFEVVEALCVSLEGRDKEMYSNNLRQSAMMIPAKIAGACGSGSWLICMQNAAIIREHAQFLHTATSGLKAMTKADKNYIKVLRTEMEEFRDMFNQWVTSFALLEREEYEDEWGLFIRPA